MIDRRDFIKLLGLFSLSGSLPLLQTCKQRFANQINAPLKIGYLPITDASPLLVAIDQGFFEKHKIQIEKPVLFRSWAQLVEAFISAQINIIHLLSPMAIWMRYASKSQAKIVMWNHIGGSALTVSLDINNIVELGGKTVAIPFWYSIHNIILQYILRANNLLITEEQPNNSNEVRVVVMAPSDMVSALAVKSISGFIVAEPFNAIAEFKGVGKILRFSADIWKDHACCITLMHEHDIKNRPNWVQKVVDALIESQLWINKNRDETALLLSKDGKNKFTSHETNILEVVLKNSPQRWQNYINTGVIRHPQWHQRRVDFQPFPFPSYTIELVKMLKNTHTAGVNTFLHKLDPKYVAIDLVDTNFVKVALKRYNAFEAFNLPVSLYRQETIIV